MTKQLKSRTIRLTDNQTCRGLTKVQSTLITTNQYQNVCCIKCGCTEYWWKLCTSTEATIHMCALSWPTVLYYIHAYEWIQQIHLEVASAATSITPESLTKLFAFIVTDMSGNSVS